MNTWTGAVVRLLRLLGDKAYNPYAQDSSATDRHDDPHQQQIVTAINAFAEQYEASEQQRHKDEGKGRAIDTSRLTIEKITMWAIIVGGIAALASLFYVARSANAAKDAADTAKDSLVVAQRAFLNHVNSSEYSTKQLDRATGKVIAYSASVGWLNSGNTPAIGGRSNVQTLVSDKPIGPSFQFPSAVMQQTNSSAVGPHATMYGGLIIPIKDVASISSRHRVYMYGWVTYRDVFPGTPVRLTEFCEEIIRINATVSTTDAPPTGLDDPKTRWDVVTQDCANRPCYDEGCSDYTEKTRGQAPNQKQ